MLAALLITAQAASAPAAGVSLGSAVNVSAADAEAVLVQLDAALRQAGFEARRVPGGCRGDRPCVAKQAERDGLQAIVTVAVAGSKRGLAIDLESVSSTGAVVAQLTDRFGAPNDPRLPEIFGAHAHKLAEALAPKSVAPDAPVQPRLEPTGPGPQAGLESVESEAHGPPRWLVIGSTGVAVAAGAGAVAFAVQGFASKSSAERVGADGRALHTEVEAQRLVNDANAQLTASLVCGVTAGVFAVAAASLGIARF